MVPAVSIRSLRDQLDQHKLRELLDQHKLRELLDQHELRGLVGQRSANQLHVGQIAPGGIRRPRRRAEPTR